jgi:hypothetical protein
VLQGIYLRRNIVVPDEKELSPTFNKNAYVHSILMAL